MKERLELIGLEKLNIKPRKINILNSIGLERDEITYSDLLSKILKMDVGKDLILKLLNDKKISPSNDLFNEKYEVFREYHNMDITILFNKKKYVIGIENKIDAGEGEDQLTRYQDILESYYKNYDGVFIYLTPNGTPPLTANPLSKFVCYPLSYGDLLEYFKTISEKDSFIMHFLDCIKENITMDRNDITTIKKIWGNADNRSKLKLLLENRPTIVSLQKELYDKIQAFLKENGDEIDYRRKPYTGPELQLTVKSLNKSNIPITFLFYDIDRKENTPCLRIVIAHEEYVHIPKKRIKSLKEKHDFLSFEKLQYWGGPWYILYTGKNNEADFIVNENHDYGNGLVNILFNAFKQEYKKIQEIIKDIP